MRLAPGTFLWLIAHDLRLSWRRFVDMLGGRWSARAVALALLGTLALHALAWPALPRVAAVLAGPETSPEGRLALAVLIGTVASWMVAQGLFSATRTLYDRGDLDLLYSSPQSPRRVLAAKAMAIALSSLGSVAVLALPVANVGAVRQGIHWLAVYPTLLGLALLSTAIALAVTMALFGLFGPRRARLYAHLGGALIGGSFVLAAQVIAMLPDPTRNALEPAAAGGVAWSSRLLWLPVDAALGSPWAIAGLLALSVAVFAAVAWQLGGRFAVACLEAAGAPSSGARAPVRPVRFRSGPGNALRRKEWRLLVRDPTLFAQLGLQIVYTIPLAVVLVRSGSLPIALAMTPAIVVIAAQVAASLAWIAVSGEDAPELIAAAPVRPAAVDRAKLSAIAVPVLLVAALPLAGLAMASPKAAAAALLFAAGASTSTALLNLWHPMPGNRRGMLRRHAQSKLIGLLEHLLAILWSIASVLAMLGTMIWPVPLLLVAVVLGHGRLLRGRTHGARREPAAASATSPA